MIKTTYSDSAIDGMLHGDALRGLTEREINLSEASKVEIEALRRMAQRAAQRAIERLFQ